MGLFQGAIAHNKLLRCQDNLGGIMSNESNRGFRYPKNLKQDEYSIILTALRALNN